MQCSRRLLVSILACLPFANFSEDAALAQQPETTSPSPRNGDNGDEELLTGLAKIRAANILLHMCS